MPAPDHAGPHGDRRPTCRAGDPHAIVTNEIHGRHGAMMMGFYLINTLVAMVIGLGLTNLIQPGTGASLADPGGPAPALVRKSVTDLVVELIPRSIGEAFAQNNLAQLVLLTLALGIGLVKIRDAQRRAGRRRSRRSSTCSASASS